MSQNINLNLSTLPDQLRASLTKVRGYAVLIFFLLVAAVYGFVIFRINSLSNVQPAQGADTGVNITAAPHIDQTVVDQLEGLKDNSVNVKALFDQARTNPFQE